MVLVRVCPWCRRTEPWLRGCGCLPDPSDRPVLRTVTGIDRVVAVHRYDDELVRRFVLAAKNGGREDLLRRFGVQLASVLAAEASHRPEFWTGAPPAIVWVPASRDRRRRRGYDQGRVLARAVGSALKLPVRPLLARAGGEAQEGRDRVDRLDGPKLHCRVRRAPRHVILVDDVITTGASLGAAADALRRSGTVAVIAAAVASSGTSAGATRRWETLDRRRSPAYGEQVTIRTSHPWHPDAGPGGGVNEGTLGGTAWKFRSVGEKPPCPSR